MADHGMSDGDKSAEKSLQLVVKDDGIMDPVQSLPTHTSDGTPIRKLYIANLAKRTKKENLHKVFSKYGKVVSCCLKRKTRGNRYAFVTFNDPKDAFKVIQYNCRKKIKLHGRELTVVSANALHQPYNIVYKPLINILNDDCLAYILQFLTISDRVRIERVCKRWQMVSWNSWYSVRKLAVRYSISQETNCPTDECNLRNVLLRCGRYLTNIVCSWGVSDFFPDIRIFLITELCPNIQEIDVSQIRMNSLKIACLYKTYSNLTELKLGNTEGYCDYELTKLFSKNPNLKALEAIYSEIEGTCLEYLPETLEKLVVHGCHYISSSVFINAVQRLHELRILKVVYCKKLFTVDSVLSQCRKISNLEVLAGLFPSTNDLARIDNLKELNMKECSNSVTDSFLFDVILHCPNLTTVDISRCNRVTGEGISTVFSLPNLQYLKMTELLIEDFIISKSNVPLKLKYLDCTGCSYVNENIICDVIESAPNLERLFLWYCYCMTKKVVEVAKKCTGMRTNHISLKMFCGGLGINCFGQITPLLIVEE